MKQSLVNYDCLLMTNSSTTKNKRPREKKFKAYYVDKLYVALSNIIQIFHYCDAIPSYERMTDSQICETSTKMTSYTTSLVSTILNTGRFEKHYNILNLRVYLWLRITNWRGQSIVEASIIGTQIIKSENSCKMSTTSFNVHSEWEQQD